MAEPTVLPGIFASGATFVYNGKLLDVNNNPVPASNLTAFTLTLIDVSSAVVVNGISNINVLNTGRGTIDNQGNFTITLGPSDTVGLKYGNWLRAIVLTFVTTTSETGVHEADFWLHTTAGSLPPAPPVQPSPQPNITDYIIWIRNVMGVAPNYLPDNSPNITYSFDNALQWVNQDIGQIPNTIGIWSVYSQAVYNLGGHSLVEFAPDQTWPISAASWSSGFATITTLGPNTVQVGDRITISGVSPILYIQPGRSGQPQNPNAPIYVSAVVDSFNFQYPIGLNPGAAIIATNSTASEYFFSKLRLEFKLSQFVPGVVGSTGDQGTSASLVSPRWATGLGIYSLQLIKTPWGRAYMSIAQQYGTNVWGLT